MARAALYSPLEAGRGTSSASPEKTGAAVGVGVGESAGEEDGAGVGVGVGAGVEAGDCVGVGLAFGASWGLWQAGSERRKRKTRISAASRFTCAPFTPSGVSFFPYPAAEVRFYSAVGRRASRVEVAPQRRRVSTGENPAFRSRARSWASVKGVS